MKELIAALAELVPPTSDAPRILRDKLLANTRRPRLRYAPMFGALSRLFDLGDLELAALFERADDESEWARTPIAGLLLLHLEGGPRVRHADNGLVRLAAGAPFPTHRHLGHERVVVLGGGYVDTATGRTHTRGDETQMRPGTSHAYRALPEEELLMAVSLEGGIDVEGYGRLGGA